LESDGIFGTIYLPLTCKWTYLTHQAAWDANYFNVIGLGVLADEGFSRIGFEVVALGTSLAQGLTAQAALDLGLTVGTPVAAGLIDAHAGGLGTVGAVGEDVTQKMAYIFSTSSCTMTTTCAPVCVPGVWGPYHSAMLQDMWLNEGGQSAAGDAIDPLLALHPAHAESVGLARSEGLHLAVWLANRATQPNQFEAVVRATGLHVVPDFLGNRAPFTDPNALGLIAGISMGRDVDSLVPRYLA
jgi:D-ribulokinase